MDVIKLTRELGAAIQQDERYLAFVEAKKANEADEELNGLIGKINLLQLSYQQEAGKEDADEKKLEGIDQEFKEIYGQLMLNKNMQNYEKSRAAVDDMMNYIVNILGLCVNGEDPASCEPPKEEHHCSGSCSSCGGSCG